MASVDNIQSPVWYAMSAPYRNELRAKQLLDSKGVENFLPLCTKILTDKNGKKIRKTLPIVSNLLFAYATHDTLQQIKQRASFLQYRTRKVDGRNVPIIVPDDQMRQFIAVCQTQSEKLIFLQPDEINLALGTPVRVIGGPFDGVVGTFIKVKGARARRVVVEIDGIAVATAEIEPQFIEVINP